MFRKGRNNDSDALAGSSLIRLALMPGEGAMMHPSVSKELNQNNVIKTNYMALWKGSLSD